MTPWKRALLSTYYHATLPWRRWRNLHRAAAGKAPIIVLFYHRVADDRANAWTMSSTMFREQMRWLKQRFDLVSLEDAQRRIDYGTQRPTVSVTFDDGYADNLRDAIPLLIREQIPCTYFVATRHVLDGAPFEHDLACGHRLRPNTLDELKAIADAGIEIGAHTGAHVDLGQIHDPRRLHEEVVVAGQELQHALGRRVRYFSFPFGLHANLNAAVFQLAAEAGYEAVCSAYGGYNFLGDDYFHLQRIHADDDMLRFKNWLTVDPRKLSVERFAYEKEPLPAEAAGVAVA